MNPIVDRIFSNPRTTLSSVLGIVITTVALRLLPDIAHALGSQPGLGWQLVAYALGAVPGALMKDGKPIVGAAPSSAGFMRLRLLLALAVVLGFVAAFAPRIARADDAAAAAPASPAAQFTIGSVKGTPVNLAFGLGFTGYAYDIGTKQVTKAVQFTGLGELSAGTFPLALLAGGGFQTGTAQGIALQVGPEYRPLNVAALFTTVVVGATRSYGVAAGYVVRF